MLAEDGLCIKLSHENFMLLTMGSLLSNNILLCHIIIEQFISAERITGSCSTTGQCL